MKAKFFRTQAEFHDWLLKNHDLKTELMVGFHKKDSGKKSITYPEALDEALCFGWIDGVKKALNETSYCQRFTPRKPNSVWSLVNIKHIERLKKDKRLHPAGVAAYKRRDPKRTGIYSFENRPREFSPEFEKKFRTNKVAWEFFESQLPFIHKTCVFWVMSAKKEETRLRRLNQLIESSAQGKRIGLLEVKKKDGRVK